MYQIFTGQNDTWDIVYALFIHSCYIVCALFIHCYYILYELFIHFWYIVHALFIHSWYIVYALFIHSWYIVYALFLQMALMCGSGRRARCVWCSTRTSDWPVWWTLTQPSPLSSGSEPTHRYSVSFFDSVATLKAGKWGLVWLVGCV